MLKIKEYRAGFAVTSQEIQKLINVDIQAVAQGNEVGETHFALLRPVEDCVRYCSRLRDKRQFAFADRYRGETGIQPLPGGEQAQAIRAKDTHLVAAGVGEQFGLLFRWRRENNAGFTPFLAKCFQQFQIAFRIRTQHGEVRHKRQALHIWPCQHPLNGLISRRDGHDGAIKSSREQVAHHQIACPIRFHGCADNGNGFRT